MLHPLRPYQNVLVEKARAAFARHKRVIMYLATGGGKTETSAHVIKAALAKGKRVAFVCNRIGLVSQVSRRFIDFGFDEFDVFQGENSCIHDLQLAVASVETLVRRDHTKYDLIVIDEAHNAANSKSYQKLLAENPEAYVLGLTATPFAKGLGKTFQALVSHYRAEDLIREGFLVPCRVFCPSDPDLSGLHTKKNSLGELDYDITELSERVNTTTLVGDIVQNYIQRAHGLKAIAFCVDIDHSKAICDSFCRAGIPAEHLDYHDDVKRRDEVLGKLKSGEVQIVTNSFLLSEGLDVPSLGALILAAPTKSLTRYIQMCGRVLRPFPGKTEAIILDHAGIAKSLGMPTDNHPLILDDGKKKDAATKKREEAEKKEVKSRVCPSCLELIPRGPACCPACGHRMVPKSAVEHVEGQLVELSKASRKDLNKVEWQPEHKTQIWHAVLTFAEKKKYSPSWAWNFYKDFMKEPAPRGPVPATPADPKLMQLVSNEHTKRARRFHILKSKGYYQKKAA